MKYTELSIIEIEAQTENSSYLKNNVQEQTTTTLTVANIVSNTDPRSTFQKNTSRFVYQIAKSNEFVILLFVLEQMDEINVNY